MGCDAVVEWTGGDVVVLLEDHHLVVVVVVLNIIKLILSSIYLNMKTKKAAQCDVIQMRDYPCLFRGFLSHTSSLHPSFL